MSMDTTAPFKPVNNDRMAAFTAFRSAPVVAATVTAPATSEHLASHGAAAVALVATPAPKTTRLADTQADTILSAMQQENETEMLNAHSGLDADRVARLLRLLD